MRQRILDDLVKAMKEKDKELLSVLRMVKGAMMLEEINVKRELNDSEVLMVISKQIKTRKDSITEFEKANRTDLIEKTQSEIDLLEKYLPKQLTEEEIKKEVEKVIDMVKPTSPKDMGKVMKELSSLRGKADMSLVSKLVKEMM